MYNDSFLTSFKLADNEEFLPCSAKQPKRDWAVVSAGLSCVKFKYVLRVLLFWVLIRSLEGCLL